MTVENISWSISMKECCRPRQGLNPRPPGLQSDGASKWGKLWEAEHFFFHTPMLTCTDQFWGLLFTYNALNSEFQQIELTKMRLLSFELEFYSPVNTIKVMLSWSVYLTSLLLSRLSPLGGYLYLCILLPETDNCPSWIIGKGRMTVENISWSISMEKCCHTWQKLNLRPPDQQSNVHLTEPPRPVAQMRHHSAYTKGLQLLHPTPPQNRALKVIQKQIIFMI